MKGQKIKPNKITLGITGGFGTGKTTVANCFKNFGAKIIDADKIARRLTRPGSKVYKRIISIFGVTVLKKNKFINREKLSQIVFNSNNLLERLNQAVHPEVIKVIKKQIKGSAKKIIILDVPLLFEAGLQYLVDKTIVVRANKDEQLKRLVIRTSLSRENILKRINAQMRLSDKIRQADFVIDNNGTIEKTKKQVERLRRVLWKN